MKIGGIARPVVFLFLFLAFCVDAQTQDRWVYNDLLASPWIDGSWSTLRTFNSTEQVYSGSFSVKVVQRARGGLLFLSGDARSPAHLNASDYTHLEFAIYNTTPGLTLDVHLENNGGSVSRSHEVKDLPLNQWIQVSVPMTSINPDRVPIHRIVVRNQTDTSKTYFVDALRLR